MNPTFKNILIFLSTALLSLFPENAQGQTKLQLQQLQYEYSSTTLVLLIDEKCAFLSGATRSVTLERNKSAKASMDIYQNNKSALDKASYKIRKGFEIQVASASCAQIAINPKVKTIKVDVDFITGGYLTLWERLYGRDAPSWDGQDNCATYTSRETIQSILAAYQDVISSAKTHPKYNQFMSDLTSEIKVLKRECKTGVFVHKLTTSPINVIIKDGQSLMHYAKITPNAAHKKFKGISSIEAFRNTLPKEDYGISMPWAVYVSDSEKTKGGGFFSSYVHFGFLKNKQFAANVQMAFEEVYEKDTFKSVNIKTIKDGKTYILDKRTSEFVTGSQFVKSINGKQISNDIGQFVLSTAKSASLYAALEAGSAFEVTTTRMVNGKAEIFKVSYVKGGQPDYGFDKGIAFAFAPVIMP